MIGTSDGAARGHRVRSGAPGPVSPPPPPAARLVPASGPVHGGGPEEIRAGVRGQVRPGAARGLHRRPRRGARGRARRPGDPADGRRERPLPASCRLELDPRPRRRRAPAPPPAHAARLPPQPRRALRTRHHRGGRAPGRALARRGPFRPPARDGGDRLRDDHADRARHRQRSEDRPPALPVRPHDGPLRVAVHAPAGVPARARRPQSLRAADARSRRARRAGLRRDLRAPPSCGQGAGRRPPFAAHRGARGRRHADDRPRDPRRDRHDAHGRPGDDDLSPRLVVRAPRPAPGGRAPAGGGAGGRGRDLPRRGDPRSPATAAADTRDGSQAARRAAGRRLRLPIRVGPDAEHLPGPPGAVGVSRP
jgi:hypothetical protein